MRPPSGNFERLKFILRGNGIETLFKGPWVSLPS
jgi:hypothetical protein